MKILFIYPENLRNGYKPISIALLSGALKRAGHETSLFDTSFFDLGIESDTEVTEKLLHFKKTKGYKVKRSNDDVFENLNKRIAEFRPDLICLTTTTIYLNLGLHLLMAIKEKRIPIVVGGIHPTIDPEGVIKEAGISYLCIGEGENALVDLCTAIEKGKDTKKIPNIWAKIKGKVYRNNPRPPITDLDSLPMMDYDIFDYEEHFRRPYQGKVYRFGDFMTSKGCVFSCSYCFYAKYRDIYSMKPGVYHYSPRRLVDEIVNLKKRFNLTFIKFHDSDFMLWKPSRLKEFARLYKKEVGLPFVAIANIQSTTEEKIRLIKMMGCQSISLGVESGSRRIREKILNRQVSNKKIIEMIHAYKKHGIRTVAFNMIGIPTETRKDIFKTIQLNRKARPDISDKAIIFPFPGTHFYDYCLKNGFLNRPFNEIINIRTTSVLDLPTISKKELDGLNRTFQLYVFFPKIMYPLIRIAEGDGKIARLVFDRLSFLYGRIKFGN